MSIAADTIPRGISVTVTGTLITATLADGRLISVPLSWSWRLERATAIQRANYTLVAGGTGFHWPEVDEDISVEGMLRGTPAPRPSR